MSQQYCRIQLLFRWCKVTGLVDKYSRSKFCAVCTCEYVHPLYSCFCRGNESLEVWEQNKKIIYLRFGETTNGNNWSHVRRYPPALRSCFYNLWRDNCKAFHLSQLELFWVNKHNLFLSSFISIVLLSFFLTSTINAFISRLPLVLQRHSPGTQLSLQPSKSSCTPPSALYLIFLLSPSFLPTRGFAFHFCNDNKTMTVCKSSL